MLVIYKLSKPAWLTLVLECFRFPLVSLYNGWLPSHLQNKAHNSHGHSPKMKLQTGPAPYIAPLSFQPRCIIRVRRNIQRLQYLTLTAFTSFLVHCTHRWEGYAYNDLPILNNYQNSGVLLCAGRPGSQRRIGGPARAGLIFLVLFASMLGDINIEYAYALNFAWRLETTTYCTL